MPGVRTWILMGKSGRIIFKFISRFPIIYAHAVNVRGF